MKFGIILFAFSLSATAAEKVDNQRFYATREQQIFKEEDKREFKWGYIKGDDVPFATWSGFVSGRSVYIEVHGNTVRLQAGEKWTILSFASAPALPGGDAGSPTLDDKGADIYVKSAKDRRDSLICIESLGPDIYTRHRPYWEVYVITNPLADPGIYRISGINADCRGIERAHNGNLLVPTWDVRKDKTPGVVINYYAIEKNGFRKTGIRFTGSIASEYADEYIIDSRD
ncbi:hypothetical protein Q4S45_10850 [Massilia sp. R2A-15]|uniref:hypothetical protein n=1 Tax=Massilia sp. R2A-15 TaxID=3064278 RepID=UPI002733D7E4|nr:hypothetical protein [Massilia sp. R2A-15]WLI91589.1 hypothetical protein Q4S45_10850 [Massilia sp. R2A-15]